MSDPYKIITSTVGADPRVRPVFMSLIFVDYFPIFQD